MVQTVLIVGGGVTGLALACEIARRPDARAVVLEQAEAVAARGSTTIAPGFVGLFNDSPLLTDLAVRSADVYDSFVPAFTRAGGLELAQSASGQAELVRRVAAAHERGLAAELLDPAQLPATVRALVDEHTISAAASFPQDGVADAPALLQGLRDRARRDGAVLVNGQQVTAIADRATRVVLRTATGDEFEGDACVLAGGVWGRGLAELVGLELPLYPVAHPYAYSDSYEQLRPGPYLRWPEHHVYARVHHDRLGIGSYDHRPVAVTEHELEHGASLSWRDDFAEVIDRAQRLLAPTHRFTPSQRINGVFAMTPDNLPFIGPVPNRSRVWIAQALWITHAAGAAHLLASAILEHTPIPEAYAPARFDHIDADRLQNAAHRLYRDIYANEAP